MGLTQAFDAVYRRDAWTNGSGPGSHPNTAGPTGLALLDLIEAYDVRSVVDVGCGDGQWMPDLPCPYLGLDVSHEAIRRSHARHPDREYRYLIDGPIPAADLVICRDVIQHLSLADGWDLSRRLLAAAGRLLVVSTYTGGDDGSAAPPESGEAAYSPDMTREPFRWPVPRLMIPDGRDWETGETLRDTRKMLGVWVIA